MYTSEREFYIMITFKNKAILGEEHPIIGSILAVIIISICLLGLVMPLATNADFASTTNASYVANATNKAIKSIKVVITAYSSTPGQTDDTPFVTASGKYVRDGIIANNGLPFGTKVRIPELYGDKIFVVEDRMNKRYGSSRFDLWMPNYSAAKNFGVKATQIEIVES
jgi:3D (Asp-Asp-Asp) domain-containing protein